MIVLHTQRIIVDNFMFGIHTNSYGSVGITIDFHEHHVQCE